VTATNETTAIEELDFEPERNCDCEDCHAGHPPATHIAIPHLSCGCHGPRLACSDCTRRFLASMLVQLGMDFCNRCGTPQDRPMRELIELRPLR
jgi:hypothetical protein